MFRRIVQALDLFGIDLRRLYRALVGLPLFVRDALQYRLAVRPGPFSLRVSDLRPALGEHLEQAGSAGGHYFHQDLWAARRIFARRPSRHVDIGSRIDGFISHLLVFMDVEVIDIRPLQSTVKGLTFHQADASRLGDYADMSIPSLSCLHAAEHFGLGRYGDPVDPEAPFRVMGELQRVLARGGTLYFSVPVGRERVCFNSHRVFSPRTIMETFRDLRLLSFSAVDDEGRFVENTHPAAFDSSRGACGMFELTRV